MLQVIIIITILSMKKVKKLALIIKGDAELITSSAIWYSVYCAMVLL